MADALQHDQQRAAGTVETFIDPAQLSKIVDDAQTDFESKLASQVAKPHRAPRIVLASPSS